MTQIKKITTTTLHELIDMENKYFPCSWSYSQFKQWLKQDSILAFGYFSPKLHGYISLSVVSGEAEITNIAVDEDYRQQGIGSQLLDYALTKLFQENENPCSRIFLEVREHNLPALRLYKKFGFKQIAMRKQYYSDDENALIMECTPENFIKNKI